MMKLARRMLAVIDEGGPREQGLMQRILRAPTPEFERAVGYLVLKGMIVFRGKTSGRKICRNGRRMEKR